MLSSLRSNILRKSVFKACVGHILATCDNPTWVTMTFRLNIEEKPYAERCWQRFYKFLIDKYPGIRGVGVWARQGRGAWHNHVVFDRRIDADWFHRCSVHCGFGPQCNLKALEDRDGDGGMRVVNYLGTYATDKNGLDPVKDKGVRRMIFVGPGVKVRSMRWVSAFRLVVRLGRRRDGLMVSELPSAKRDLAVESRRRRLGEHYGVWYRKWVPYWFELGWADLSEHERARLWMSDETISGYLDAGKVPYV